MSRGYDVLGRDDEIASVKIKEQLFNGTDAYHNSGSEKYRERAGITEPQPGDAVLFDRPNAGQSCDTPPARHASATACGRHG